MAGDAVTPALCIRGPVRWRERCRWTLPQTGGRCRRFDRRTTAERRRSRAMLACALGLAMGGRPVTAALAAADAWRRP